MRRALKWIEGILLTVAAVLGIWCVTTLIEAHRANALPIPPPAHTYDGSPPVLTPAIAPTAAPISAPAASVALVAMGTWVARFEAPSARLSATVLQGSSDDVLKRGAGHIEYTPMPGQPGNIGIAGHRDTTFRAVRNFKVGDPLVVTTADRVFRYQISWMKIVNPTDMWVLDPSDKPVLTLVTCYPFTYIGHAPQRYITRAELIDSVTRR